MTTLPTTLGRPKVMLFDLDGTLIDSAPDLMSSVNIVLGLHGFMPLSLQAVIGMIGNGVKKLVERAFVASGAPLSPDELETAYAQMMEVYGGNLTAKTTLIAGARETLTAFQKAGVPIGVVTNKHRDLTETILAHFDLAPMVSTVVGGDSGFTRKPAPDMLLAALERLGGSVEGAIMVGDSHADIESGKAAGVGTVAIRGGYTAVPVEDFHPDWIVDGLPDLLVLLER